MAVKTLLDRKAINECMTEHLDQMAPGSLLSSLGSLTRFLEFLIDTEVFRQEDMEPARRMIEHIKVLRKGMKKRVQQRRTVIQTEEIQTMIRPSDMAEFLNCPAVSEIKEKALNPRMEVVPADFFDVRDFPPPTPYPNKCTEADGSPQYHTKDHRKSTHYI
ncbi:unnamed protein product [Mytilus coruscus]|uniref:Uncharacterized protein n=1 Tax=Mytilus coruscus TaxID=42192 RepID=A0A6J8CNQ6_MYTCO|nr:unnamed protein product [Mytilus coruscus]